MLGQLLFCGLRIYLVIWAHVFLALCPNCPWCMCRYMRLPIAFWDNQQISLADSTCDIVKSALRNPIKQAIRSQWESQDLSHVLGQSVPCDGWHSISGTRVQHMCTESGIRAQGLITRVTASWQLSDNTGIRSTQLTLLLMRSRCSWLITPCTAAST